MWSCIVLMQFFLLNIKLAAGAQHLMSERTESLQKNWEISAYRCWRLRKHFLTGKSVEEFHRRKEFHILPAQRETTVVWCGAGITVCVLALGKNTQICSSDHFIFYYLTF